MTRAFRISLAAAAVLWAGCGSGAVDPVEDAGVDSGISEYDAGPVDAGPTCATGVDADQDGTCDDADLCPGSDDRLDSDHDTIPDGCDRCENHDDRKDKDGDGVPDSCDVCNGGDDTVDSDGDLVPDHCDVCPNDATGDSDHDGVCDSADTCPGKDDRLDADHDGVADGCDPFPDSAGTVDTDGDGVADGADQCPGARDGWGLAGQDLDNDLIDDGCDLCAGLNSQGDSDRDGFCNIMGTDDNCPGVSDFSPSCPASTCSNGDQFSPACPDLPWRGNGGGNQPVGFHCPQDSWAVGLETDTYDTGVVRGAKLVCKDSAGTISYQGQYSTDGHPDTTPPYELRCDQQYSDARLIGGIVALNQISGAFHVGRVGAVCSSEQAGMVWRIEPVAPSGAITTYTDVCTGPNETVTGLSLRLGWWCAAVQLSCSSFQ